MYIEPQRSYDKYENHPASVGWFFTSLAFLSVSQNEISFWNLAFLVFICFVGILKTE